MFILKLDQGNKIFLKMQLCISCFTILLIAFLGSSEEAEVENVVLNLPNALNGTSLAVERTSDNQTSNQNELESRNLPENVSNVTDIGAFINYLNGSTPEIQTPREVENRSLLNVTGADSLLNTLNESSPALIGMTSENKTSIENWLENRNLNGSVLDNRSFNESGVEERNLKGVKQREYNDDSPETIRVINCYCRYIKHVWNTMDFDCKSLRYYMQQVGGEGGVTMFLKRKGLKNADKNRVKDKLAKIYAKCVTHPITGSNSQGNLDYNFDAIEQGSVDDFYAGGITPNFPDSLEIFPQY